MKQGIHPVSMSVVYTCGSCGAEIIAESTRQADSTLDVCSNCHPAYTGKELKSVSGSRSDAFNDRYRSK